MLRIGLLIFSILLTGTGLILLMLGKCSYLPFLIWGCILVIVVLCERWRYRRKGHDRHGSQWQPTGERFEDTETGQTVEVHYDPVSGERRYVKK